jgi:hypothetical protein
MGEEREVPLRRIFCCKGGPSCNQNHRMAYSPSSPSSPSDDAPIMIVDAKGGPPVCDTDNAQVWDKDVPMILSGDMPMVKRYDPEQIIFGWVYPWEYPKFLKPLLARYTRFLSRFVTDPRDTVFVSYMVSYTLIIIPSAITLMVHFNWIHAALHILFLAVGTAPYILMLHCICHRKIAKPDYPWLEGIVHYVLNPFMGQSWNTFYYHHVKHHHIEGNGPKDLSSTMLYDRDNALHFLAYFFRFFLFCWIELPIYFIKLGHYQWAFNVVAGEVGSWTMWALLFWLLPNNTAGVIFAFVIPFVLTRYGMMSGNWAQHAFINPADPDNDFVTSITCINTPYNTHSFNDGYHTSHHLMARRRWDEHPTHLVESIDLYRSNKAIIFNKLDFHSIWTLLMLKDYDTLAKNVVQCGRNENEKMSHEEIKAMLKFRTKRMTREQIAAGFSKQKQSPEPSVESS